MPAFSTPIDRNSVYVIEPVTQMAASAAAATDAATDAPAALVGIVLLTDLVAAVNDANGRYNALATKYNNLATRFNALEQWLRDNGFKAS